jgi:outer membrane lipoprotein-sorting protein
MAKTEHAPDATLSLSNCVSSLTPTVFEQMDKYYEDITSVARTWTSV